MKSSLLIFSLCFFFGFDAFSSTIDGYTLPITGEEINENFEMKSIQTRTEYKNESVAKTCYRRVHDGYRNVCQLEPEVSCYYDHYYHQYCNTRFVNRCYSEAQYRQEPYTCFETVSTPYEVFSHNVKAFVNVLVKNSENSMLAPHNTCNINFTLEGDFFKSQAQCSEYIILSNKKVFSQRKDSTVIHNQMLNLTLIDAKKATAATSVEISEMRVSGQTLIFRSGDLTKDSNFSLKLFVERKKLLKEDEVLISRVLDKKEYSFEKTNDNFGFVKIDLEKLIGKINTKKKHVIKVEIKSLLNTENAINTSLPLLFTSKSIIVNE